MCQMGRNRPTILNDFFQYQKLNFGKNKDIGVIDKASAFFGKFDNIFILTTRSAIGVLIPWIDEFYHFSSKLLTLQAIANLLEKRKIKNKTFGGRKLSKQYYILFKKFRRCLESKKIIIFRMENVSKKGHFTAMPNRKK